MRLTVKCNKKVSFLPCLLLIVAAWSQANSDFSQRVVADGAALTRVETGFEFTEGPAVDRDGNVYFTDRPNNGILKWTIDGSVSVFLEGAGRANGLYFDRSGNLLAIDRANFLTSA